MPIHGDGTQSRDFTYVENVVQANVLAAERDGVGGTVLNVATGRQATVERARGRDRRGTRKAGREGVPADPDRRRDATRGPTSARPRRCSATSLVELEAGLRLTAEALLVS